MKEREERKADLEKEEKKRDYQARKTHYLLSTKQVGYLSLTARRGHLGPQTDRDKLAGRMGHDLLKRYPKDTTSSSIPRCCHVGARRHQGSSVTAASQRRPQPGRRKGPSQQGDPPPR